MGWARWAGICRDWERQRGERRDGRTSQMQQPPARGQHRSSVLPPAPPPRSFQAVTKPQALQGANPDKTSSASSSHTARLCCHQLTAASPAWPWPRATRSVRSSAEIKEWLGWKASLRSPSSKLGLPTTAIGTASSGCPWHHPARPWALPGMGYHTVTWHSLALYPLYAHLSTQITYTGLFHAFAMLC